MNKKHTNEGSQFPYMIKATIRSLDFNWDQNQVCIQTSSRIQNMSDIRKLKSEL